jgi:hypothetical protein
MRLRVRAAAGLIALLFTAVVRSDTVDVKYRGNVDLKTFSVAILAKEFRPARLDWSQLLMVKGSENLTALIVRRSHNRPRTAALLPRFCQTMRASSVNN